MVGPPPPVGGAVPLTQRGNAAGASRGAADVSAGAAAGAEEAGDSEAGAGRGGAVWPQGAPGFGARRRALVEAGPTPSLHTSVPAEMAPTQCRPSPVCPLPAHVPARLPPWSPQNPTICKLGLVMQGLSTPCREKRPARVTEAGESGGDPRA